jgi:hypothetical protein
VEGDGFFALVAGAGSAFYQAFFILKYMKNA